MDMHATANKVGLDLSALPAGLFTQVTNAMAEAHRQGYAKGWWAATNHGGQTHGVL